jgi:serine beta-lactamase-like protein LACTB, mitochondrial
MNIKSLMNLPLLLLVALILLNCKKQNTDVLLYNRKYIDELKAVRKDIGFYMARNYIPGGTFAIAKEGEIIYSEGFGTASKDLDVQVTRNTKFRIGEVSELFTSLIYQKLLENNTLHPDSSVQFYLPEFPEKEYRLPIGHLPYHTSGIREPNFEERDWRGLNISLQKGIENFKSDSLVAPPGIYQIPSIYNYNLLGAIMEKATGEHFPKLLAKYVTDTLNLANTLVDNPFATIKGRSNYYDHNFVAQVVNATFRDMRYRAPSQGILSNAGDLVKFGNALLYSDYFTEKIKNRLFEPFILSNGLPAPMANGWMLLTNRSGRKIYGKSGSVTGGSAAILVYPEEKLVVACAVNLTSTTEDFPVFLMANHFLPEQTFNNDNDR